MRHTTESESPPPRLPAPTSSFTFVSEESMANGPYQDTVSSPPSSSTTGGPKFRPYASSNHHVTKGRYITSNDPRGYIPVYEYPLNGQWIMMDIDDGYILWTGIWKALGNSKADIVKMIDSQPDLAAQIRRVRGGYLKIQGTWMPYEVALRLSRRVAWTIREDLVPLFGPTFPSTCLAPDQPGYGQVVASGPGRRRTRKSNVAQSMSTSTPSNSATSASTHQGWTVFTSQAPSNSQGRAQPLHSQFVPQYAPFSDLPNRTSPSSPEPPQARSTSRERASSRYAPYPHPSPPLSVSVPASTQHDLRSISPLSPLQQHPHNIVLPPIVRESGPTSMNGGASYALPPISALEDLRGVDASDSAAVLRRLKGPDPQSNNSLRLGPPTGPSARSPGYAASSCSSLSWPPPEYHSTTTQNSLHSIHKLPSDPSMRSHHSLRSYNSRDSFQSGRLSVSVPSDSSCAPSPISPPSPSTPATPLSVASMVSAFGRESVSKEHHYHPSQHPSSDFPRSSFPTDSRRGSYGSGSLSRRSSESSDMHVDHGRQPHRPW